MQTDPERERARLADLYANMPLEQLREIASDPMSLTEIARTAIDAELQRRGIPEPEESSSGQSRKGTESESDPPRLVVLCRYRDLHETMMAKRTLDSAGIQSFMADENTVRMDWLLSNAIGGIRLFVREEDASEAADLLAQPIPDHLDVPGIGEYQQPTCPRCDSLEVAFAELNKQLSYPTLLIGIPLPFHRRGWHCETCGHAWGGTGEDIESSSANQNEQ
jgi:hypothetical protein